MSDVVPNKWGGLVRIYTQCLATGLIVLASTGAVSAQDKPKSGDKPKIDDKKAPTAQTHPNDPSIWNVDQMMEDAVVQISRRYNLNPAQENYTRLILVKRVRAFLKDHESDVRELLKESIDMRLGLKTANGDALKSWADRAQPIYDAAMQAILDGNKEWGDILNADQKKIHEADLAAMHASFDGVNRMLGDWKQGKTTGFAVAQAQPQATHAVQTQGAVDQSPVSMTAGAENDWLTFVKRFISAYKLDEKQSAGAEAIYRDQFAKAKQYRESHKGEFESITARVLKATKPEDRQELDDAKFNLERPIRDLFVEMERRLDESLTQKQRTAIEPDQKTALKVMSDEYSGRERERNRSHKPSVTTAEPATSRPAVMDSTAKPALEAGKPESSKSGESGSDAKPDAEKPGTEKPAAPKDVPAKPAPGTDVPAKEKP